MLAQRAYLNWAAEAVAGISGPVLELGLGNGRTYDHMRELMPEREIYVFERAIGSFDRAHATSLPPEKFLILGDIEHTLVSAGHPTARKGGSGPQRSGNQRHQCP